MWILNQFGITSKNESFLLLFKCSLVIFQLLEFHLSQRKKIKGVFSTDQEITYLLMKVKSGRPCSDPMNSLDGIYDKLKDHSNIRNMLRLVDDQQFFTFRQSGIICA